MQEIAMYIKFDRGRPNVLIEKRDDTERAFADSCYKYVVGFCGPAGKPVYQEAECFASDTMDGGLCINSRFPVGLCFRQEFRWPSDRKWLDEIITLTNHSGEPLEIMDLQIGFRRQLRKEDNWRLIAVPFRVQVDGKTHDYSTADLLAGRFCNSDQKEHCWTAEKLWPSTVDNGKLRSEAWLIQEEHGGLLVAKYNNEHIEYSMAQMEQGESESGYLRFGGVGLSLYNEPQPACRLNPEQSFTFGLTRYIPYEGKIAEGYRQYKKFLNNLGHSLPDNYNPLLGWNELYDIGWQESDKEKLAKFYTPEALLGEAAKASEIGCEFLYLDPGWEVCEGENIWDEQRLGKVDDFVNKIKTQFGLDMGFRIVGNIYRNAFDKHWYAQTRPDIDGRGQPDKTTGDRTYWRFCSCCTQWRQEMLRRVCETVKAGMKFMMVDEASWFSPCYATDHGHLLPTTPEDHTKAIYGLIKEIRTLYPDLRVEAHDPVWSWFVRYLPVYFMQGFGQKGCYEENWGFELMWNNIEYLKTGAARCLYYYAMGTDIPLYLHISMATDNDKCLFFWWAASTIRHLAIGGKYHNFQPELRKKHCPDPETRWREYKKQVAIYKSLKEYFVRGDFHGLGEHAHLHTLSGKPGGVVNLFNLSDDNRRVEVAVSAEKLSLQPGAKVNVQGDAEVDWDGQMLRIAADIPAWSPRVIAVVDK